MSKLYSYEYRKDDDEVFYSPMLTRRTAMMRAKKASLEKGVVVYVLDDEQKGHVAFIDGKADHKEGAII
jgi:hypothetical protein